MSKLAKKIAPSCPPQPRRDPSAHGPRNLCWPLYGQGDLEDWEAVEALRDTIDPETGKPREWRSVQRHVDSLLKITQPIDLEKFRRHWRRRCDCWPPELKL